MSFKRSIKLDKKNEERKERKTISVGDPTLTRD